MLGFGWITAVLLHAALPCSLMKPWTSLALLAWLIFYSSQIKGAGVQRIKLQILHASERNACEGKKKYAHDMREFLALGYAARWWSLTGLCLNIFNRVDKTWIIEHIFFFPPADADSGAFVSFSYRLWKRERLLPPCCIYRYLQLQRVLTFFYLIRTYSLHSELQIVCLFNPKFDQLSYLKHLYKYRQIEVILEIIVLTKAKHNKRSDILHKFLNKTSGQT